MFLCVCVCFRVDFFSVLYNTYIVQKINKIKKFKSGGEKRIKSEERSKNILPLNIHEKVSHTGNFGTVNI